MAEHRFQEGNQYAKGHGRPKGSSRIKECEDWVYEKGIKKLIQIADSNDLGFRTDKEGRVVSDKYGRPLRVGWSRELQFEAVKLIFAYGVGKPTEFIAFDDGGQTIAEWATKWFGSNPPTVNGHANGNGNGGLHKTAGEDPK